MSSASVGEATFKPYRHSPLPLASNSCKSPSIKAIYKLGELFPPCFVPCAMGKDSEHNPLYRTWHYASLYMLWIDPNVLSQPPDRVVYRTVRRAIHNQRPAYHLSSTQTNNVKNNYEVDIDDLFKHFPRLCSMFNKMFTNCVYPTPWSKGVRVPIYKTRDKSDPANYRGITLVNGTAKVFLACRSRQASIVLERYFRFEVSLLSFYACERDGAIWVSGGSDIIT